MKKSLIPLLMPALAFPYVSAQTTGSSVKRFKIDNKVVVNPQDHKGVVNPEMQYKILPKPHPGTDKETIRKVKEGLEQYRRNSKSNTGTNKIQSVNPAPPVLMRNFQGMRSTDMYLMTMT